MALSASFFTHESVVMGGFRRPKISDTPSPPTTPKSQRTLDYSFFPASALPKRVVRAHKESSYIPQASFVVSGRHYVQAPNLSQESFSKKRGGHQRSRNTARPPNTDAVENDQAADEPPSVDNADLSAMARQAQYARKKEKLKDKWENTVIPSLIDTYHNYLRLTESLRHTDVNTNIPCTCDTQRRMLNVICVYFDKLKSISLTVCACSPAAVQLLRRGLFPCAPTMPTLAVDLSLLDFVSALFLNMSPNVTAWCETLEGFWLKRSYKLKGKDNLRFRFSNSLRWYGALVHAAQKRTSDFIEHSRVPLSPCNDSHDNLQDCNHRDARSGNTFETTIGGYRERPSDYLRKHCPLCFSDRLTTATTDMIDVIVCLDACFTQKRRKKARDPKRSHPDTVFIPEEEVKQVELQTDAMRTQCKRKRKTDTHDDHDGYDVGMKVPRSVLDECRSTFVAADEKREKASTQFFDDTGLMALLCRHDRVLWLVNMTSAGERQHYALALLRKLLDNLPSTFKIGVMYDIACQLHQSCVKWGFLGRDLHRIHFALSVLHAYGHQWPCQIVYHPRKRVGFGFSDGEGCERFWSQIKKLIPGLRVSGYHQRLYTLDNQVQQLQSNSLEKLGDWLARRASICRERKVTAEANIWACGLPVLFLQQQWNLQLRAQTKPTPRQSKKQGKLALEEILVAREAVAVQEQSVVDLEKKLVVAMQSGTNTEGIAIAFKDAKLCLKKLSDAVSKKERALGISDQELDELEDSEYLRTVANANVLLHQLIARICGRKFEYERLGQSNRNTANESKARQHTSKAIEKRDSTITNIARNYNTLCRKLEELIRLKRAPKNAVAPKEIPLKGLFSLDIDDPIWNGLGLLNDSDDSMPKWLYDEHTREGIRALHLRNRCEEEESRLRGEVAAMRYWLYEEWQTVNCAIERAGNNADLVHQLTISRDRLLSLCVTWDKKTKTLFKDEVFHPWGPSLGEMLDTILANSAQDVAELDGSEVAESEVAESEQDEAELLDILESIALTEGDNDNTAFFHVFGNLASVTASNRLTPRKIVRVGNSLYSPY